MQMGLVQPIKCSDVPSSHGAQISIAHGSLYGLFKNFLLRISDQVILVRAEHEECPTHPLLRRIDIRLGRRAVYQV